MWFKVGIKDTNWCRYIELDSENKDIIISTWFNFAGAYLSSFFFTNAVTQWYCELRYPDLCTIEMMEKPPQEWIKNELKLLDEDLKFCEEQYNKLSDLLEPEA
jgi:hypothetical protein